MEGGGDEEKVLGYEKFYPFFVGVRKTLPLFCWGTKNFIALLGYEKYFSFVGMESFLHYFIITLLLHYLYQSSCDIPNEIIISFLQSISN